MLEVSLQKRYYTLGQVYIATMSLLTSLYTGKSDPNDFHAIYFSHENHAIIMRKSDEKVFRANFIQICCTTFMQIFFACFSCD